MHAAQTGHSLTVEDIGYAVSSYYVWSAQFITTALLSSEVVRGVISRRASDVMGRDAFENVTVYSELIPVFHLFHTQCSVVVDTEKGDFLVP